MITSSWK